MSEARLLLPHADRARGDALSTALDLALRSGRFDPAPLAAAVTALPLAILRVAPDDPAAPESVRALRLVQPLLREGDAAVLSSSHDAEGGDGGGAGGELIILRPGTMTDGWLLAEQLRTRIAAHARAAGNTHQCDSDPITLSIGVAAAIRPDDRCLIGPQSDEALALARGRGGDRVCTFDMVRAERQSRAAGRRPWLSTAARRARFIHDCSPHLGPTQREHLTDHSERVADLAARLARRLGADPTTISRARLSGLLHDIGKAAIPEDLLAKPGALTVEERAVMDRHAEEGARLAARLGADDDLARSVLHHHTRYDAPAPSLAFPTPNSAAARTAPANSGAAIPLEARLVSVADAVVAMTTDRPYRAARTTGEAIDELLRCRGRQFDPVIVDAAASLLTHPIRLAA